MDENAIHPLWSIVSQRKQPEEEEDFA